MTCPSCKGNGYNVIAPGYVECTNIIVTNRPVNTAAGTAIVPMSSVCGYRYQTGSGGGQVCACGTFAIGLCHDCGVPVCGDCSSMVERRRICGPCTQLRLDRAKAAELAVADAAVADIAVIADPIERFLRITYLCDTYEMPTGAWDTARPAYQRWLPESPAVSRWFAARATAQGVAAGALETFVKRPALLGRAKFVPGDPIPCWGLWNRPEDPEAEPRYVLFDGQVVTYHVPRAGLYKPGVPLTVTGVEQLTPVSLDRPALLKMIELLSLRDDRPGLKRLMRRATFRSSRSRPTDGPRS